MSFMGMKLRLRPYWLHPGALDKTANQRQQEKYQENEKENLRYPGCSNGNSGKPEQGGNQSHDEEYDGPSQHS
jgi:hypothetical protein